MALEAIQEYIKSTGRRDILVHREENLREGWTPAETCRRLE